MRGWFWWCEMFFWGMKCWSIWFVGIVSYIFIEVVMVIYIGMLWSFVWDVECLVSFLMWLRMIKVDRYILNYIFGCVGLISCLNFLIICLCNGCRNCLMIIWLRSVFMIGGIGILFLCGFLGFWIGDMLSVFVYFLYIFYGILIIWEMVYILRVLVMREFYCC